MKHVHFRNPGPGALITAATGTSLVQLRTPLPLLLNVSTNGSLFNTASETVNTAISKFNHKTISISHLSNEFHQSAALATSCASKIKTVDNERNAMKNCGFLSLSPPG